MRSHNTNDKSGAPATSNPTLDLEFERILVRRTLEVNPALRAAFDTAMVVDSEYQSFKTSTDHVAYARNMLFLASSLDLEVNPMSHNDIVHDFIVKVFSSFATPNDDFNGIDTSGLTIFNPHLDVTIFHFPFDEESTTPSSDAAELQQQLVGLVDDLYRVGWLINDTAIYRTSQSQPPTQVHYQNGPSDD